MAANAVDGATTGELDAVGSMMAYFTGLIERRRTEPADDISPPGSRWSAPRRDTAHCPYWRSRSPWSPAARHRSPAC